MEELNKINREKTIYVVFGEWMSDDGLEQWEICAYNDFRQAAIHAYNAQLVNDKCCKLEEQMSLGNGTWNDFLKVENMLESIDPVRGHYIDSRYFDFTVKYGVFQIQIYEKFSPSFVASNKNHLYVDYLKIIFNLDGSEIVK